MKCNSFTCTAWSNVTVHEIWRTKFTLKQEIGLQIVHVDQFVTEYADAEKQIRFLLQQPGIQDARNFQNDALVVFMYDNLDEFQYISWSSVCTGETSIQFKIVEPNNLLRIEIGR